MARWEGEVNPQALELGVYPGPEGATLPAE
jgi:hypothetical protein